MKKPMHHCTDQTVWVDLLDKSLHPIVIVIHRFLSQRVRKTVWQDQERSCEWAVLYGLFDEGFHFIERHII